MVLISTRQSRCVDLEKKNMRRQTTNVIETVLAGDPTVSEHQRESIAAIISDKPPPLEAMLIKQGEVAKILSRSRQYVWRLQKQGILTPVQLTPNGHALFRREEVMQLVNQAVA